MHGWKQTVKITYHCSSLAVLLFILSILSITTGIVIGSSLLEGMSKTATYDGLQADEFMKTWYILDPIPVLKGEPNPEDEETQQAVFGVEYIIPSEVKPGMQNLSHMIEDKDYKWQLVHSDNDIVDLTKTFGDKEFVVIYAWAEIIMPEEKSALLGIGSDDGVKVWLNGELVHQNWIGRPVREDDDLFSVKFQKGKNQLLLKVQNMQYGWGI